MQELDGLAELGGDGTRELGRVGGLGPGDLERDANVVCSPCREPDHAEDSYRESPDRRERGKQPDAEDQQQHRHRDQSEPDPISRSPPGHMSRSHEPCDCIGQPG